MSWLSQISGRDDGGDIIQGIGQFGENLKRNPLGMALDAQLRGTTGGLIGYTRPGEAPAAGPSGPSASDQRQADIDRGSAWARKELYDDPEMKRVAGMREDLAKGYSGQALGAVRAAQRAETEGARQGYLQQLQGRLGRAGVGGARGAAMKSAADRSSLQQVQQGENALALQQENALRQGQQSLEDFLMKRKFGVIGAGLSSGGFGAQERAGASAAASAASQEPKRGFLGQILGDLF